MQDAERREGKQHGHDQRLTVNTSSIHAVHSCARRWRLATWTWPSAPLGGIQQNEALGLRSDAIVPGMRLRCEHWRIAAAQDRKEWHGHSRGFGLHSGRVRQQFVNVARADFPEHRLAAAQSGGAWAVWPRDARRRPGLPAPTEQTVATGRGKRVLAHHSGEARVVAGRAGDKVAAQAQPHQCQAARPRAEALDQQCR